MSRYLLYLLLQIIVIVGVITCFKVIESKEQASLIAGALFISLSVFTLGNEARKKTLSFCFYTTLLFFAFSALPIFLLRISHPGEAFEGLALFSVPAPLLHRMGNIFYLIMMLGTFVNWYRVRSLFGKST